MQGWFQIILFCLVFTACVPFLGGYMARVFTGERVFLSPVIGPLERLLYRVLRVDTNASQGWKSYAGSLLVFSGVFWLFLYLILHIAGNLMVFLGPDVFNRYSYMLVSNPRVSIYADTARLEAMVEAQHVPKSNASMHYLMKNRYDVQLIRQGDAWVIKHVAIDNVWRDGDPAVLAGI